MRRRLRRDDGSTVPLILGFFLIALFVVAGSVTASDAFVGQRDVQSICDGATLAAANAVDLGAVRGGGVTTSGDLPLAAVQQAAETYLARDSDRRTTTVATVLSPDARTVAATCRQLRPVAFGAMFGHGGGITHVVQSSARTAVAR